MNKHWKPITNEIERKVLVTNNINSRDSYGQMSHVWCVNMVHEDGGDFCAFAQDNRKIWGLKYYCEIPMPETATCAS